MTNHTKQIKYNAADKDWAIYVDGDLFGYAPTKLEAEARADAQVYSLIEMETRYDQPVSTPAQSASTADQTPVALDQETLFLVREEAAAGVPEAIAPLAQITRDTIARAADEARAKAANNPRWLNAIDKATQQLEGNAWAWYATHETLRIASATNPGSAHRATAYTCDCTAYIYGRPCHHIAAARLLRNAQRAA